MKSPPRFLFPFVKFQEMAALLIALLAPQVHPLDAPTWPGLILFPFPDPKEATTYASCCLVMLTTLSLLGEPTIWAKVTSGFQWL